MYKPTYRFYKLYIIDIEGFDDLTILFILKSYILQS